MGKNEGEERYTPSLAKDFCWNKRQKGANWRTCNSILDCYSLESSRACLLDFHWPNDLWLRTQLYKPYCYSLADSRVFPWMTCGCGHNYISPIAIRWKIRAFFLVARMTCGCGHNYISPIAIRWKIRAFFLGPTGEDDLWLRTQ